MKNQSFLPGVVMLDIQGHQLDSAECDLLLRPSVGGLILFSRNYESPAQLRRLVQQVRDVREELLIAVDQEGGRVQRFRQDFLALPPLHSLGLLYRRDTEDACALARLAGWAMAAEILHFGIDLSFAPVLDLYSAASRVIGNRAFSDEPAAIVQLASSYIAGMNEAGMAATGKHFPGHGSVIEDSHLELPVDERPAQAILSTDFQVFAEVIELLAGIMPAHVVYPAIDAHSAGYSTVWLQEKLRGELGFQGVIFSDDLSMAAADVTGDPVDRAARALQAGCDMILVCNDRESALKVCSWVEEQGTTGSAGLHTLRGNPDPMLADLYNLDKWKEACTALEMLHE